MTVLQAIPLLKGRRKDEIIYGIKNWAKIKLKY